MAIQTNIATPHAVSRILERNQTLWMHKQADPQTFQKELESWQEELKERFIKHRGDLQVPPVISIIIPVHNEETHILPTLHSLAHQTGTPPFEVLLVVNNADSTDRSAEIGRATGVRVIEYHYRSKKQRPISVARQQGLIFAQGTYCFSTDADIVAMPHWVKKLHAALAENDEVGYATSHSRLIDWEKDKKVKENNAQRIFTRETFDWTGLTALGNNTAFRHADAEELGGYNLEIYPAEDTEFGVRLTLFLQKKPLLITDEDATVWLSPRRVLKHGYDTLIQELLFSYRDASGDAINVRDTYDRLVRENTTVTPEASKE